MDLDKSFSCSRWKEGCPFTIWKVVAKKKLSAQEIESLLKEGRTNLIKGFTGKKGKFDACLLMKEGKVSFEFFKVPS